MAAQPDMPTDVAAVPAAPGAVVVVHGSDELPRIFSFISRMNEEQRDWTPLLPELVRKMAEEKLLAVDVTEYINFRAICKPWRGSTEDTSLLHPRFLPRNWLMLKPVEVEDEVPEDELVDLELVPEAADEPPAKKTKTPPAEEMGVPAPPARRFLNVRTGAVLHTRLPDVEDYGYVVASAEGLLVLNCERTDRVRIFNPLTRTMTELPGLAGAPKPADALLFTSAGIVFDAESPDRPAGVLVVAGLQSVAILCAKPGDEHWGTVDISVVIDNAAAKANKLRAPPPFNRGLSLHGRFFVATRQGDVLEVSLGAPPRPRLVYVLRPPNCGPPRCTCSSTPSVICHLAPSLDDDGAGDNDGMLLVRCLRMTAADVYGVHLGKRSYTLLMVLGNRTIFLPSTTLRADKFPLMPQGTVRQQYEQVEDYIG